MKRGWKVFWIVCGIAASAGIVFCMTGGILGATLSEVEAELRDGVTIGNGALARLQELDDMEGWEDGVKYEYGEHAEMPDSRDSYRGIRELDINVAGVELQILPSEDGDIHVETEGITSKLQYRCEQDGGTLEIETTSKLHLINRMDGHASVWVYLPEDQLEEIDISNKAGVVYIEKISAREFKLDMGAGEGVAEDFAAQDVELVCGAGEITASGTVMNQAEVECGVGEINLTLQGKEEEFGYEVECGVGSVQIGGHDIGGIGVKQSNEEYYENHHRGNKNLSIDCGVGSVCVEFVQ